MQTQPAVNCYFIRSREKI